MRAVSLVFFGQILGRVTTAHDCSCTDFVVGNLGVDLTKLKMWPV